MYADTNDTTSGGAPRLASLSDIKRQIMEAHPAPTAATPADAQQQQQPQATSSMPSTSAATAEPPQQQQQPQQQPQPQSQSQPQRPPTIITTGASQQPPLPTPTATPRFVPPIKHRSEQERVRLASIMSKLRAGESIEKPRRTVLGKDGQPLQEQQRQQYGHRQQHHNTQRAHADGQFHAHSGPLAAGGSNGANAGAGASDVDNRRPSVVQREQERESLLPLLRTGPDGMPLHDDDDARRRQLQQKQQQQQQQQQQPIIGPDGRVITPAAMEEQNDGRLLTHDGYTLPAQPGGGVDQPLGGAVTTLQAAGGGAAGALSFVAPSDIINANAASSIGNSTGNTGGSVAAPYMQYRVPVPKHHAVADGGELDENVFVENKGNGRFTRVKGGVMAQRGADEEDGGGHYHQSVNEWEEDGEVVEDAMHHLTNTISRFYLLASGFLAGMAAMQGIIVSAKSSNLQFLSFYSPSAGVIRFWLYFFTVNCTVLALAGVLTNLVRPAIVRTIGGSTSTTEPQVPTATQAPHTLVEKVRLVLLAALYSLACVGTFGIVDVDDNIYWRYERQGAGWHDNIAAYAASGLDAKLGRWNGLTSLRMFCSIAAFFVLSSRYVFERDVFRQLARQRERLAAAERRRLRHASYNAISGIETRGADTRSMKEQQAGVQSQKQRQRGDGGGGGSTVTNTAAAADTANFIIANMPSQRRQQQQQRMEVVKRSDHPNSMPSPVRGGDGDGGAAPAPAPAPRTSRRASIREMFSRKK